MDSLSMPAISESREPYASIQNTSCIGSAASISSRTTSRSPSDRWDRSEVRRTVAYWSR